MPVRFIVSIRVSACLPPCVGVMIIRKEKRRCSVKMKNLRKHMSAAWFY